MIGIKKTFRASCEETLRFLVDQYDCSVAWDSVPGIFAGCTFKNRTTAVSVALDLREAEVTTDIIRLVDAAIPEPSSRHWLPLHEFASLMSPEVRFPDCKTEAVGNQDQLRELLVQVANILRGCADSVLKGDFSDFDKALLDRDERMSHAASLCNVFERECRRVFCFLVDDYAFDEPKSIDESDALAIRYEKRRTHVAVKMSRSTSPIYVVLYKRRSSWLYLYNGGDIMRAAFNRTGTHPAVNTCLTVQSMTELLEFCATLVQQTAGDVLEGRFPRRAVIEQRVATGLHELSRPI